nr:hypothetical protein [Moorena sp. SIO3F7]
MSPPQVFFFPYHRISGFSSNIIASATTNFSTGDKFSDVRGGCIVVEWNIRIIKNPQKLFLVFPKSDLGVIEGGVLQIAPTFNLIKASR